MDLHPEYNNATIAVNNSGWHHSKESIEKMVSSRTGKIRILRDHKYSTPSPIKNPNYINKQKMKPVEQYTIEGVYIRGYDSISSAARSINRKREGIRDCCSGR
nr:MAG: NUMOD1 domain [Bacteriophage sp.]